MNRRLASLLLLFAVTFTAVAGEQRLLLVHAPGQAIAPLTTQEVRMLFLGVPVLREGRQLRPLINVTDPMLHQVFLQKILFMSASKYKHQLLARVFREGGVRPPFLDQPKELYAALHSIPDAVTYSWDESRGSLADVEVIQVLWHGSLE